jgi:N-acetylmuramoyl-L-alanine amidase
VPEGRSSRIPKSLGDFCYHLTILWVLVFLVGCESPTAKPTAPSFDLSSQPGVATLAVQLEADAQGKKAPEAAERFMRAADLREQSYLRDGKRLDALAALDLWDRALPLVSPETACDLEARKYRLSMHLDPDPDKSARSGIEMRERLSSPACRAKLDRMLPLLEPFSRPHAPDGSVIAASKVEPRGVVAPHLVEALPGRVAEITGIETFSSEESARIVVRVTEPTLFDVGSIEPGRQNGAGFFVDIAQARYRGATTFEEKGLVSSLRVASRGLDQGSSGTRLIFELARPAYHRVFYLPHPFRLIIDLSVDPPERVVRPREIRRVVLDPGHGGHDPGAVSPFGLREKDVTLDIAHRAAPLLAREVGVSTLLTRDVDAYVPLDERAARANAFHADLFLSIHLNSSPDPAARGVMTFVLDSSRDDASSEVAARENASTAAAAAELANSLSGIQSADRRAASLLFAELLQRAAGASLRQVHPDILDHGVQPAGFYVLAGATMPAALFEGSFLSNPVESKRLNSEGYRQRLADAIVNAVRAYKEGRN